MDSLGEAVFQNSLDLPTILVIEDDEDNRLLLKHTLDMFNYQSLIAADATHGLFLAKTCKPDIILLDIVLAKISGLKLAYMLKSHKTIKKIPIIALTGLSKKNEIKLIFNSGCDGYLCKPYLLDDLKTAIETQLDVTRNIKKTPLFCLLDENFNPA